MKRKKGEEEQSDSRTGGYASHGIKYMGGEEGYVLIRMYLRTCMGHVRVRV